jgi:hypothetical protein
MTELTPSPRIGGKRDGSPPEAAGSEAVEVGQGTGICASLTMDAPGGVNVPIKKTSLASKVTAPVSAKALPHRFTPVVSVMLACAMISPLNRVAVPRVAELPTCQTNGQCCVQFAKETPELLAVVSVLPIWKTKPEVPP